MVASSQKSERKRKNLSMLRNCALHLVDLFSKIQSKTLRGLLYYLRFKVVKQVQGYSLIALLGLIYFNKKVVKNRFDT